MLNLFLSVIPVKTGIQCFQYVLDTRLRGYDELTEFINRPFLTKVTKLILEDSNEGDGSRFCS